MIPHCGCSGVPNGSENLNGGDNQSWIGLSRLMPKNPMDVIAYAALNATAGTYLNSSTFVAPGTWIASGATIIGTPTLQSLATDAAVTTAYADQWIFTHLTGNANVALPLRKLIFLKHGRAWNNKITIGLGGANFDGLELSFRDNAATRGDATGTVPTISFTGTYSGNVTLDVTLARLGVAVMGLKMRNTASGDYSMFEMEWHIVA